MSKSPSPTTEPTARDTRGVSYAKTPHACGNLSNMNPPSYISYSQFSTWLDCGEKYRLTRVVQVEEDPAWFLIGGRAVHVATETIDRMMQETS